MNFFYEIFDASLPQLGPGESHSTLRALEILYGSGSKQSDARSNSSLRILDLGSGNGPQTIELAKYFKGPIIAVDNCPDYLAELNRRAKRAGVIERIETLEKDMSKLEFKNSSFDLIWSEGALYSMGVKEGLAVCHKLLANSGLMGMTELTWLSDERPAACADYFANEYPAMKDIKSNLELISKSGFEVLEHFTLSESAWLDSFYLPLEARLKQFRERYAEDQKHLELINLIQTEIDLYRKYSSCYGYVFYLMKRC